MKVESNEFTRAACSTSVSEQAESCSLVQQRLASLRRLYTILGPYPSHNGQFHDRYYAFSDDKDMGGFLGKGAYGEVYKAYLIDSQTGELDKTKQFAVKICSAYGIGEEEYKIFAHYYKCEPPITKERKTYFITECFPGSDLFDKHNKLHQDFQYLPLGIAFEFVQQLVIAVNSFQHYTPRTGPAIMHCDIKGQNIKAWIDPSNGSVHVYLFDFGLAETIAEENPQKTYKMNEFKGTIAYLPVETLQEKRGLKSDIYSLVPLIISLLGGYPFAEKKCSFFGNPWKCIAADYSFDNMLAKYAGRLNYLEELTGKSIDIRKLVETFINRMQSGYRTRPDSDQVLSFFTTLNKSYKLYQAYSEYEQSASTEGENQKVLLSETGRACLVKMMLLAHNYWIKSFSQFDFDDDSKNRLILKLLEKGKLTMPVLKHILTTKKEVRPLFWSELRSLKDQIESRVDHELQEEPSCSQADDLEGANTNGNLAKR